MEANLKDIEFKGIVINRVPEQYKKLFKEIAKEEFCDDYGMCLRQLLASFLEYSRLKEMFFTNNLNIEMNISSKNPTHIPEKGPTNLVGEEIFKKTEENK